MSNLKDAGANLINRIADDAEIAKDVYDNGLKPAVIETGKALTEPIKGATRVGRLLNAICADIDCWILKRDYMVEETKKLLEKKLEKISNDDIEPPKNYIAIPALQALSYSIDSEELRNMYANLLAKSMYKNTSNKVHPAYVEIVRQLDPMDIKIFEYIASNEYGIAIKKVSLKNISTNGCLDFLSIATSIQFAEADEVAYSFDNLLRLGLIELGNEFIDEKFYEEIDNNPMSQKFYKEAEKRINDSNCEKLIFKNKAMYMTALGRIFYEICNEDIE